MIFSSATFLFIFLPFFLLLYFSLPWKNSILLVASLFFYAWGEPFYIFLLLAVIGANYLFGLSLSKNAAPLRKKIFLFAAVAFNIAVLAYFKYSGFFLDNINEYIVVPLLNREISFSPPALPLGISFIVFQAITYAVDIYRERAPEEKNPLFVGLYISMFPKLVAGPIVRFEEIFRQMHSRSANFRNFTGGIERIIVGMGKKLLIADTLSVAVDSIFSLPPSQLPAATAWFGSVCYTLQIYYDFSGYSDMAIGMAKMMGFKFPENFNFPYQARTVQEFWRRWHMTLSFWFRDYLYIPLGGNRRGKARTYFNLLFVFTLVGFWHGANWTFLFWGFFHGSFLVAERMGLKNLLSKTYRPLQHLYLVFVVSTGWVFFRAPDLSAALGYLKAMFGFNEAVPHLYSLFQFADPYTSFVMILAVLFSGTLIPSSIVKIYRRVLRRALPSHRSWRVRSFDAARIMFLAFVLVLSLMTVASQTHQAFIYFRF